VITFVQLDEAIFCETMYCYYRNNELAHKRRPLPRGPKWIIKMKDYLDWMNEQATKPKVEVVTEYRTRNGTG
jgi:hypothetical protein